MTGFGQAEEGAFKVEVRSLNHRFLEINVKLPQGMMEHDSAIRNAIKGKFARGRFDVFVNIKPEKCKAVFNTAAAAELEGVDCALSIDEAVVLPALCARPLVSPLELKFSPLPRGRLEFKSRLVQEVEARLEIAWIGDSKIKVFSGNRC